MKKLIVKSLKNGYRRAGYAFSSVDATILDASELSAEQIEQITNDKKLTVVVSEEKVPAEPKESTPVAKEADTSSNNQTPNISKGAAELIAAKDLDVAEITGTGRNDQITKTDVTKFIEAMSAE